MFMRPVAALVALLLSAGALAQIYKWVDEDGVIHYSDQPADGAERIDLPAANTMSSSTVRRATLPSGNANDGEEIQAFAYESLTFATPAAEETLWNIQGTLNVTLNVQPGLRRGDRVRVYLDGESRMTDALQFQIEEVWRGEHNLQAEVLNRTGALMIRSEPIRFYVQQTSVINN